MKPIAQKTTPGPRGGRAGDQRPERDEIVLKGSYANHKRLRQAIDDTNKYRSDPFGQIINLSNQSFTKNECELLGYNLNINPTPKTTKMNYLWM